MPASIRDLEPNSLWNCFADLNAVPRPSKREDRVVAFVRAFAERNGLSSILDNAGNVINELKLVYNKTRQAGITKGLSEIVAGAAAV